MAVERTQSMVRSQRTICSPSPDEVIPLLRGGNKIPSMLRFHYKYGDVVRLAVATNITYFLFDPDDIREVLVNQARSFHKGLAVAITNEFLGEGLVGNEGEMHKRHRRMIQPAFHRQRIAGYANMMTEIANEVSAGWRDGQRVRMTDEMMRFTFLIVGKTLFNFDPTRDTETVQRALDDAMNAFVKVGLTPLAKQLRAMPLPSIRRMHKARERMDVMIDRLIAEHRASAEDQGDVLSALLTMRDEDGGGMSDQEIRDESLTLLMAGHETTANWLGWTWYLLSQNPEVVAKLHEELDSALEPGMRLTIEDMRRLPYTENVLFESMRLYPPVWAVDREALSDVDINGIHIEKGARVIASQYVAHRDSRYFLNAERFNPDRWTPEFKAARPKFAFFPFGGGSRLCIGEQFAWAEAILGLATLARAWDASLVPGAEPRLDPAVTLRPDNNIPMILHKR